MNGLTAACSVVLHSLPILVCFSGSCGCCSTPQLVLAPHSTLQLFHNYVGPGNVFRQLHLNQGEVVGYGAEGWGQHSAGPRTQPLLTHRTPAPAVAKPLPLSELAGWGFPVQQLEQQVCALTGWITLGPALAQ